MRRRGDKAILPCQSTRLPHRVGERPQAWDGVVEDAAVRTSFKEWCDEQEQQQTEQALQDAVRDLRLTNNAAALFRGDVTTERGTFGRTADAIATVSQRWHKAMADARAALEANDVEVLATPLRRCRPHATMSVRDAAAEASPSGKKNRRPAIVQGVWDSSHGTVKRFDGEPRFQPNIVVRLGLQRVMVLSSSIYSSLPCWHLLKLMAACIP